MKVPMSRLFGKLVIIWSTYKSVFSVTLIEGRSLLSPVFTQPDQWSNGRVSSLILVCCGFNPWLQKLPLNIWVWIWWVRSTNDMHCCPTLLQGMLGQMRRTKIPSFDTRQSLTITQLFNTYYFSFCINFKGEVEPVHHNILPSDLSLSVAIFLTTLLASLSKVLAGWLLTCSKHATTAIPQLPTDSQPLAETKIQFILNAVCFKLHGRATLLESECVEQHFISSSDHRKPSTGLQSKHFCNLLEFGTPWPLTLSSTCRCNEPEEIVCGVLDGDLISMCGCDVVLVRVWLKIVGLLSHQQTSVL